MVVTSSMRLVSLAAGGEDEFYDYFVYVGKDKATGKRDAFVFNGGTCTKGYLTFYPIVRTMKKKDGGGGREGCTFSSFFFFRPLPLKKN